jgi:hypothetical protein
MRSGSPPYGRWAVISKGSRRSILGTDRTSLTVAELMSTFDGPRWSRAILRHSSQKRRCPAFEGRSARRAGNAQGGIGMPLVARTRTRASEGFMETPSLRFKPGAVCHVCSLRQLMSSAALDRLVPRREDGKASPHCQAPSLDHRNGPFERQGGKHV